MLNMNRRTLVVGIFTLVVAGGVLGGASSGASGDSAHEGHGAAPPDEAFDPVTASFLGCDAIELEFLSPLGSLPFLAAEGQIPVFSCEALIAGASTTPSVAGYLVMLEVDPAPGATIPGADGYFHLDFVSSGSPELRALFEEHSHAYVETWGAQVDFPGPEGLPLARGQVTITQDDEAVGGAETTMMGLPVAHDDMTWGLYVFYEGTLHVHELKISNHEYHGDGVGRIHDGGAMLPTLASHRYGFDMEVTFDVVEPVPI